MNTVSVDNFGYKLAGRDRTRGPAPFNIFPQFCYSCSVTTLAVLPPSLPSCQGHHLGHYGSCGSACPVALKAMAALQLSASVTPSASCSMSSLSTLLSLFPAQPTLPISDIKSRQERAPWSKPFYWASGWHTSKGAQKHASWPAYKAVFPCSQKQGMAPITEDLHANKGSCVRQSRPCLFCTSHIYSLIGHLGSALPNGCRESQAKAFWSTWLELHPWMQRKQPYWSCSFFVESKEQSTWPVMA